MLNANDLVVPTDNDDPVFVRRVAEMFCGSIRALNLLGVSIIRIDNFFDRRWFRFAGKVEIRVEHILGRAGVTMPDHLQLPPFHPNRVVEERHLGRSDAGYVRIFPTKPFHPRQRSTANIGRAIDGLSLAVLWFSSGSAVTKTASAMSYVADGSNALAWYAAFRESNGWDPFRVVGTDSAELKLFEAKGASAEAVSATDLARSS